jgi:hypothetical protein
MFRTSAMMEEKDKSTYQESFLGGIYSTSLHHKDNSLSQPKFSDSIRSWDSAANLHKP